MNRKQFLRRSILFGLAAAGMPRIARAGDKKSEDEYKRSIKAEGEGEKVYRISLDQSRILSAAADDSIRLVLEVTFYKGYSFAADETGKRVARYTLQRVGVPKEVGGYQVTNWKLAGKVAGEDLLKGRIGKTLELKLRSKRHLVIQFSASDSLQLDYDNPDESAYDDCFLTTACTASKGLPDDCAELTTLRRLRDEHMKPTAAGLALIAEYYCIAPGIVAEVNSRNNSAQIWDLVYDELVAPVAAYTESGRIQEAIAHYAAYTSWMKEAFVVDADQRILYKSTQPFSI